MPARKRCAGASIPIAAGESAPNRGMLRACNVSFRMPWPDPSRTMQRTIPESFLAGGNSAAFLFLATVWLVIVAWSYWSGIELVHADGLLIAVATLIGNLVLYHGRSGGERASALAGGFAAFVVIAYGLTSLMYLAATLNRPLIDPYLAAADAALGFDWVGWYRFVHGHPLLLRVLLFAYWTMQPQILCALFLLPITGRFVRLREFIASLAVALLLTTVMFGTFPAEGAWVQHAIRDPADLSYLQVLRALRAGQFTIINFDELDGLVTFPSFHVASAVLLINAARGTPLMPLAVVLNATMAVASISEGMGGHYLMDAVGGIAVACLGIAAARGIETCRETRRRSIE
ncbi:MAG: phosphatase PAP2 family protein [Acetobacteraceae bacterium]